MITSCYINDGDMEKPLLTVFTQEDVEPWGELCFSYSGPVPEEDVAVCFSLHLFIFSRADDVVRAGCSDSDGDRRSLCSMPLWSADVPRCHVQVMVCCREFA
jgi:hypothetical protein